MSPAPADNLTVGLASDEPRANACDYCQLPLPGGDTGQGPAYCCLGCRLAAEITGARGEQSHARGTLARLALAVFLSINVMMFTMALWTADVYDARAAGAGPLAASLADLFRYLCLVMSLPVLFLLGGPVLDNALQSRRRDLAAADLLILLGVAASFIYSAISVFRGAGHVYFEVGCAVLIAVTFGRWLEATGRARTAAALDALETLLPAEARVIDRDGRQQTVALDAIRVGERLRVDAGERFASDGRIVDGHAHVDQQLLTGESCLVAKSPGDDVMGGSLNVDGQLLIEVTTPPRGGSLARLVEMVRAARASKGHYQRTADRVAAWFLPGVISLAIVVLAFHTWQTGFEHGLMAGLAVLLIACPCALGVATPLAVWNALAVASRSGVLFRDGDALERLAGIRAIRFDKTGTLTTGSPRVSRFVSTPAADIRQALVRAALLAGDSTHAFSAAIARFAHDTLKDHQSGPSDSRPPMFPQVITVPGRGLEAYFDGEQQPTKLGSAAWLSESAFAIDPAVQAVITTALERGESLSAIGYGGRVQGVFMIAEIPREEARLALAECIARGCDVAVLTGDHRTRGEVLAHELEIDVVAGLLPADKVAALAAARKRFGPVAMVGDGVNDAPALEAADLGIALGCGADVSRESAQVCLLGNDLRRVAWAIDLARRVVQVIRQNLFWAFAYNVVGLALAACGWLNPPLAAVAMVLSSVFVVVNSSRIARESAPPAQPATGDQPADVSDAHGEPEAHDQPPAITAAPSQEFLVTASQSEEVCQR